MLAIEEKLSKFSSMKNQANIFKLIQFLVKNCENVCKCKNSWLGWLTCFCKILEANIRNRCWFKIITLLIIIQEFLMTVNYSTGILDDCFQLQIKRVFCQHCFLILIASTFSQIPGFYIEIFYKHTILAFLYATSNQNKSEIVSLYSNLMILIGLH